MKKSLLLLVLGLLGSAAFVQAADEAKPAYPLATCVVSGEKLGEMGPPPSVDYKGTAIEFCCKSCIKPFNATPDKYLQKYEQAVTDAKPAK